MPSHIFSVKSKNAQIMLSAAVVISTLTADWAIINSAIFFINKSSSQSEDKIIGFQAGKFGDLMIKIEISTIEGTAIGTFKIPYLPQVC